MSKNRREWQTVKGLAEVCGIPRVTLIHILEDAKANGSQSFLFGIARRYGYSYKLMGEIGKVIDVESRGPFPVHHYPETEILE